jgi:hypothetical protein
MLLCEKSSLKKMLSWKNKPKKLSIKPPTNPHQNKQSLTKKLAQAKKAGKDVMLEGKERATNLNPRQM